MNVPIYSTNDSIRFETFPRLQYNLFNYARAPPLPPSDTHFLFYFSSASVALVSYKILAALRGAERGGPDYAVKIKFPRLARGASDQRVSLNTTIRMQSRLDVNPLLSLRQRPKKAAITLDHLAALECVISRKKNELSLPPPL